MHEFSGGRHRVVDYMNICNTFADSYPEGVSHGVQKDAIQNAVDAGVGHKPVVVEIAVVENSKGRFITMADGNTSGLTGPVLEGSDYEKELGKDFHWARFESFGFTKADPDAIGARGQGKFIFLRASKKHTMYYDTLRRDGVYRVGATHATKTDCPILPRSGDQPWEQAAGAKALKDSCDLSPLTEIGTRVIIVDPIDELVESIENGSLQRAVQETWFRAIEKQRLIVRVKYRRRTEELAAPLPFPLPRTDAASHKTWVLGKDSDQNEIVLLDGRRFRVKHFHAVCFKNMDIPEDLRGVAVIQNGMKITSLPMELAPPEVCDRLVGYVEFDRGMEQELRKGENQDPNHYQLKWKRRVPQAIKEYVRRQLEAFGKEKLGLGVDPREVRNQRRTLAEEWAMRQLMKLAPELDLFGAKGRVRPPPPPPPPPKVLGVSINNFSYPNPDIAPRVNWGHRFEELHVTAYNNTESLLKVATSCRIVLGDKQIMEVMPKEECILDARSQASYGPFTVEVSKDAMPEPGKYRIVASLKDSVTGDEIDRVSRWFWVEKDPELRYPFKLDPCQGFPEPNQYRQWITSGSINSSPTVHYNTEHPAYRIAEDGGEASRQDYMFEVVLQAAVDFILRRPDSPDGKSDFHPLEGASMLGGARSVTLEEVPSRTYQEVMRYLSEVRWLVMST